MASRQATMVLAKIGHLLLDVQSTEKAVKLAMQIAMPRERDLFTSVTERVSSKDIRRPLGPFFAELRKRATLHNDVDELVARFLVRRNAFIHNLSELDGWSLKTEAGIKLANDHLNELLADSREVRTLFLGLLHAWKVQVEMQASKQEQEAFEAITSKYEGRLLSRKWGVDV
jgi:hypothetical protein